jgi:hypothetical protein
VIFVEYAEDTTTNQEQRSFNFKIAQVGKRGAGKMEFDDVRGVTELTDGKLAVADSCGVQVLQRTKAEWCSWEYFTSCGGRTSDTVSFTQWGHKDGQPVSVCRMPNGGFAVGCYSASTDVGVQVFDKAANWLYAIPHLNGNTDRMFAYVTADEGGNILVVGSECKEIKLYQPKDQGREFTLRVPLGQWCNGDSKRICYQSGCIALTDGKAMVYVIRPCDFPEPTPMTAEMTQKSKRLVNSPLRTPRTRRPKEKVTKAIV